MTTTLFPLRLLLGAGDTWTIVGIALLTAITVKKFLNRYVNEVLGPKTAKEAS